MCNYNSDKNGGKWTKVEHIRFLEGLIMYGYKWLLVTKHVSTRDYT